MEIRQPTPQEVSEILPRLNEEFIYSKNRLLPIEIRFPELFEHRNYCNLFAGFHNGSLATFVAVKTATVVASGREVKVFLIGSVFTDKQNRGKGLSSQLMEFVQNHYISKGFNLGLLWTGINPFYEKLGWVTADNGVFVSCSQPIKNKFTGIDARVIELDDRLLPQVDALRTAQSIPHFQRMDGTNLCGYHTVYPPGEKLFRLVNFGSQGEVIGYLLGAENNSDCFIYEINSLQNDDKTKLQLLQHIQSKYIFNAVKINLVKDDSLLTQLKSCYTDVIAKSTNIQMYFCQDEAHISTAQNLYVSFADRI